MRNEEEHTGKNPEKDEKKESNENEEDMDVVHASATEVVVKGKNIEDMTDKKAEAKNLTKEEERKIVEDNILGEFYD